MQEHDKIIQLTHMESTLREVAKRVILTADVLERCRTISDPAPVLLAWTVVIERQSKELECIARVIRQEADAVEVAHGRKDGSSSVA